MKVMLVDADLESLRKTKVTLGEADPFLKMTLLTNGREALELLARESHDVVIADLSLPGLDGLALLEQAKRSYPAIIRILVDGDSDRNVMFRAMNVAHQVLKKPLDGPLLWALISQTAAVLPLLRDDTMRAVVGNVSQLPPAPRVYTELGKLLERPKCNVDEVVAVIGRDPAIASRLLRLANSAFFAQRGQSLELRASVVRLGFNTIRNLMLTVELFHLSSPFGKALGRELDQAQQNALLLAKTSEQLARGTAMAGDAFVAGLLADIGQIVLLMTQSYAWKDCRATARLYKHPLQEIEEKALGVTHAEVGAYLLGVWGLPYSVVEAVANHHHAERIIAPIYSVSAITAISAAIMDDLPIDENWLVNLKAKTRVDVVRERVNLS
jgi:HD-like signal output (HDOD) protein